MNRFQRGRLKKRYATDLQWSLLAAGLQRPDMPLRNKIRVELKVCSNSKRPPDRDNWTKWVGDAMAGYLIVDDQPKHWECVVLMPEYVKKRDRHLDLLIQELDEAI